VPRYVDVLETGKPIRISVEDIHKYHGFLLPGGVAHAVKVMQRVFPILAPEGPLERREVRFRTPFLGDGARDAFEMVTRASTGGRFVIEPSLARPERGKTLSHYVFELSYRDVTVTALVREGLVRDEFIALGNKRNPTPEEKERLTWMKQEMADRLLALPAGEVYDVELG
jgi:hypothetical protein